MVDSRRRNPWLVGLWAVSGLLVTVIGAGLALVVGALLVGARHSSATRASTAGSNADAHTR